MTDIAFEQIAPFLSSSPVTMLCLIVWYELREVRKTLALMGERIASLEVHVEKN